MGDINILGQDIERDPGIETAIVISLFSDQRAEIEDELPGRQEDRRGWWGDTEDFKIGSKLWLLMRSSYTPDIPGKLNQYILAALEWMKTDGVAKDISTEIEKINMTTAYITIKILQPSGQERFFKYAYNWEAEILKRG